MQTISTLWAELSTAIDSPAGDDGGPETEAQLAAMIEAQERMMGLSAANLTEAACKARALIWRRGTVLENGQVKIHVEDFAESSTDEGPWLAGILGDVLRLAGDGTKDAA